VPQTDGVIANNLDMVRLVRPRAAPLQHRAAGWSRPLVSTALSLRFPSDSDVSFYDMNPMSLFLLGRRLMQIAEGALPTGQWITSGRLVFVDVAYHPDTSISEITERTGFPQSLVSTAVAKLRDSGLLESGADPRDRRRTLVRTTPALNAVEQRLESVSIDDVLSGALTPEDQDRLGESIAALDLLARLLIPEVVSEDSETARAPLSSSGVPRSN
jgi:DNA-binding MarR family transcriptional regulator